ASAYEEGQQGTSSGDVASPCSNGSTSTSISASVLSVAGTAPGDEIYALLLDGQDSSSSAGVISAAGDIIAAAVAHGLAAKDGGRDFVAGLVGRHSSGSDDDVIGASQCASAIPGDKESRVSDGSGGNSRFIKAADFQLRGDAAVLSACLARRAKAAAAVAAAAANRSAPMKTFGRDTAAGYRRSDAVVGCGGADAGALVAAVRDEASVAGEVALVSGVRPAPACGCLPILGLRGRGGRADGQGGADTDKSSKGESGSCGSGGGGSGEQALRSGKPWIHGVLGEVKGGMRQGVPRLRRSLKAGLRGTKQALLQAGDSAVKGLESAAPSGEDGRGCAPGWAHIGVRCMGGLVPRPMQF
ncbi:hypothetical protein MNEG_13062, partial [Monoraphidium neglectum]